MSIPLWRSSKNEQTGLRLKKAKLLNEPLLDCAWATGSTSHEGNGQLSDDCKARGCTGKGNADACEEFIEATPKSMRECQVIDRRELLKKIRESRPPPDPETEPIFGGSEGR